jgi:hypothetical protein
VKKLENDKDPRVKEKYNFDDKSTNIDENKSNILRKYNELKYGDLVAVYKGKLNVHSTVQCIQTDILTCHTCHDLHLPPAQK